MDWAQEKLQGRNKNEGTRKQETKIKEQGTYIS